MKTKAKSVKYYIILRFSPNGTHDIFEKMNDTDFLVQSLVEIVKKQFQSKDVEYCIKFICCSTNLSNAGRQKAMAKQPYSQKELHANRKKESYTQMEPAMRKNFCLIKKYGTSHWIPKEKKSFCPNQQIGINPLVLQKNNIFSLAEQVGINRWILHKNKIELYGLTCSILHKNEKKSRMV